MNKENCALKLVDEIILHYDARSKKISKYFIAVRFNNSGVTSPTMAVVSKHGAD